MKNICSNFLSGENIKKLVRLLEMTAVYYFVFFLMEQRKVEVTLIHVTLDDVIPFCEYFVVPYLLWFPYIAICAVYFCLAKDGEEEYGRLLKTLITGMAVFVGFSLMFPNGQALRPVLQGENVFERLVLGLYQADTSTNIFPSLHVFNSIACCISVFTSFKEKKFFWLRQGTLFLTIAIVLSTMFLKQHSVLDVLGAILLNVICYCCLYMPEQRAAMAQAVPKTKRSGRMRRLREYE